MPPRPGNTQPGERLEGGDSHDLTAGGKRQALDGRDANPQTRERPRAGGNREQVDVGQRQLLILHHLDECLRQALGMRLCRVARHDRQRLAVTHQRRAASPGRRVECKNQHRLRLLSGPSRVNYRILGRRDDSPGTRRFSR